MEAVICREPEQNRSALERERGHQEYAAGASVVDTSMPLPNPIPKSPSSAGVSR